MYPVNDGITLGRPIISNWEFYDLSKFIKYEMTFFNHFLSHLLFYVWTCPALPLWFRWVFYLLPVPSSYQKITTFKDESIHIYFNAFACPQENSLFI